jgi:membrane-bound ClpP family serine protease
MIGWSWCPAFSWLYVLLVLAIIILFIGIILAIVGASGGGTGATISGVIMIIIGVIALFVLGNWKFNADKQMAYQIARGKSVQAMEMWVMVDEMFQYQAKDTFFETKYGGKTLRVLRDGTIEIQGCHNDVDVGATTKASFNKSMNIAADAA